MVFQSSTRTDIIIIWLCLHSQDMSVDLVVFSNIILFIIYDVIFDHISWFFNYPLGNLLLNRTNLLLLLSATLCRLTELYLEWCLSATLRNLHRAHLFLGKAFLVIFTMNK